MIDIKKSACPVVPSPLIKRSCRSDIGKGFDIQKLITNSKLWIFRAVRPGRIDQGVIKICWNINPTFARWVEIQIIVICNAHIMIDSTQHYFCRLRLNKTVYIKPLSEKLSIRTGLDKGDKILKLRPRLVE